MYKQTCGRANHIQRAREDEFTFTNLLLQLTDMVYSKIIHCLDTRQEMIYAHMELLLSQTSDNHCTCRYYVNMLTGDQLSH
jgi:hypothetical protein